MDIVLSSLLWSTCRHCTIRNIWGYILYIIIRSVCSSNIIIDEYRFTIDQYSEWWKIKGMVNVTA